MAGEAGRDLRRQQEGPVERDWPGMLGERGCGIDRQLGELRQDQFPFVGSERRGDVGGKGGQAGERQALAPVPCQGPGGIDRNLRQPRKRQVPALSGDGRGGLRREFRQAG
jgi:hypothetical protein